MSSPKVAKDDNKSMSLKPSRSNADNRSQQPDVKSSGDHKSMSVRPSIHPISKETSNTSVVLQQQPKRKSVRTSADAKSRMSAWSGPGRDKRGWRLSGKEGFKVPKFQNTYRLEPYLPFRFQVSDRILEKVMERHLKGMVYHEDAANTAQQVAADVRDQLYKTDYDRVKYVVIITIIERAEQGFNISHGNLWDSEKDTYSTHVWEADTFFAVGIVCALYYE